MKINLDGKILLNKHFWIWTEDMFRLMGGTNILGVKGGRDIFRLNSKIVKHWKWGGGKNFCTEGRESFYVRASGGDYFELSEHSCEPSKQALHYKVVIIF